MCGLKFHIPTTFTCTIISVTHNIMCTLAHTQVILKTSSRGNVHTRLCVCVCVAGWCVPVFTLASLSYYVHTRTHAGDTQDILPWEQYEEEDLTPFKGSKRNLQEALEGTNMITNPNTKLVCTHAHHTHTHITHTHTHTHTPDTGASSSKETF